jgi:hypothetical protein
MGEHDEEAGLDGFAEGALHRRELGGIGLMARGLPERDE